MAEVTPSLANQSLARPVVPGGESGSPAASFVSRDLGRAPDPVHPPLEVDRHKITTSASTSYPLAEFTRPTEIRPYGGDGPVAASASDSGFKARDLDAEARAAQGHQAIVSSPGSKTIAPDDPGRSLEVELKKALDAVLKAPDGHGRSLTSDPPAGSIAADAPKGIALEAPGGKSVTPDVPRVSPGDALVMDKGSSLEAPRASSGSRLEVPKARDLESEIKASGRVDSASLLVPDRPARDLESEARTAGGKASQHSLIEAPKARELETEFKAKDLGTIPVAAPKARDLEAEAKSAQVTDLAAQDPSQTGGLAPKPAAKPKVPEEISQAIAAARGADGKPLTQEQQEILKDFYATATAGATPQQEATAATDLTKMLQSKTFAKPDHFGRSLFDYLKDFNQSAVSSKLGATKNEVARTMLDNLGRPETINQGDGTLDCAEATLEAMLAQMHPADYARVAVGLAMHGEAVIPGAAPGPKPDKMTLPDLKPEDRAGRDSLSFGIQQAMEGYIGGNSKEGLDGKQAERLYDAVLGGEYKTISKESFLHNALLQLAIGKVLTKGSDIRNDMAGSIAKATIKEDGIYHSVAVVGYQFPNVNVWDPSTSETKSVAMLDFMNQLVRVTLPTAWIVDDTSGNSKDLDAKEGGGRFGNRTRFG